MPRLTGTLTDVSGFTLSSADVERVVVKAPAPRVSGAGGDMLVTTHVVEVDPRGQFEVDLDEGPALLVVRTDSSVDEFELWVAAGMETVREALQRPKHRELTPDEEIVLNRLIQDANVTLTQARRVADEVAVHAEESRVSAGAASGAARDAESSAGEARDAAGRAGGALSDLQGQIAEHQTVIDGYRAQIREKVDEARGYASEAGEHLGEAGRLVAASEAWSRQSRAYMEEAARHVAVVEDWTPVVQAAAVAASEAVAGVAELTPRVDRAAADAAAASAQAAALEADVVEAGRKAGQVAADLEQWRQTAGAAIDENSAAASSAVAEASKAIAQIRGAGQLGTSVLPLAPGTAEPAWTAQATSGPHFTHMATGESFNAFGFDRTRAAVHNNMVAVDPAQDYDFSVWITGDAGSVLYIELRDQDGNHAVQSGAIVDTDPASSRRGHQYLVGGLTLKDRWTKYTSTIRLNPQVRFIKVATINGAHPTGRTPATAYIGDMQLRVHVPDQAQIDSLQNTAIEANTRSISLLNDFNAKQVGWNATQAVVNQNQSKWNKAVTDSLAAQDVLNKNQGRWNKAVDDALAAQTTVNAKQGEWNKAASDALAALTRAHLGTSILAVDPVTNRPEWSAGAGVNNLAPPSGSTGTVYRSPASSNSTGPIGSTPVEVNPSLEYDVTFWWRAGSSGADTIISLMDQNGQHCVEWTRPDFRDGETGPNFLGNRNSSGYVWRSPTGTGLGWKFYRGRFKLRDHVTSVRARIWWVYQGTAAWTYIHDLRMHAHVPDQAQIDAIQNQAIAANTAAIAANTAALESLEATQELLAENDGRISELVSELQEVSLRNQEVAVTAENGINTRLVAVQKNFAFPSGTDSTGTISWGATSTSVTFEGTWTGSVLLIATPQRYTDTPRRIFSTIPTFTGSRTVSAEIRDCGMLNGVVVLNAGRQVVVPTMALADRSYPAGAWTTLGTWTVPAGAKRITIALSGRFNRFGGSQRQELRISWPGGSKTTTRSAVDLLGYWQYLSVHLPETEIPAGSTVSFQIFTTSGGAKCKDVKASITYVVDQ